MVAKKDDAQKGDTHVDNEQKSDGDDIDSDEEFTSRTLSILIDVIESDLEEDEGALVLREDIYDSLNQIGWI